jgi:NAD(P)-dependent dehydrogenase (short-subunit alcohol dehydrogenase family)
MGILETFALDGRVAIVTGASSGLGAGFSRALADAGADVVLAARRADRLEDIATSIRDYGRTALCVETDVSHPEQCKALVHSVMEKFGRVDILVNNAGIGTAVPALKESPEEFRRVFDVNVNGTYWMAQECGKVMLPGSSIINISSVLASVKSFAPQAAYSSSKAAVIALTRDLSAQWAERRGIRVNAIAPGYFASEMTAEIPQEAIDAWLDTHCTLRRMGTQPELDAALIFLASPASSYVTGTTLAVDGGM